ncbi:glycosyltransferase family 20-domain-containing protein [Mycena vitilis]|nr:glycosyltransferase family 20-domain-containing protein [Mycena vitilis]
MEDCRASGTHTLATIDARVGTGGTAAEDMGPIESDEAKYTSSQPKQEGGTFGLSANPDKPLFTTTMPQSTMDSFAEPYTRLGDDIALDEVRAQVRALEDDHRAAGIPLSGRVLHVCHYLPVQATLHTAAGVPTPPPSPPLEPIHSDAESDDAPHDDVKAWTLVPRYGHAAMISGIRSLAATHEQLIVGWTGDVQSASECKVPSCDVPAAARVELEDALRTYQPKESDPDDDRKTVYVPVWLDDAVAHGHYDGYCKQSLSSFFFPLWPLFHYLLWQDIAAEETSQDAHYDAYAKANAAFAQRIAEVYKPGDLVWVHDYHLLLVPKLLRELVPDAVIGLFVHTPFPSSEVFRCLPRRKEILDGMVGADLVCFQTYSYSRHFISTCIRVCGYETTPRGIDAEGHVTAVTHCPVGVDAERVGRDILRPGIQPKLAALRALYEGKKIIVGRDKLDVVKGVLQKLHAFQKLLQTYPLWVNLTEKLDMSWMGQCKSAWGCFPRIPGLDCRINSKQPKDPWAGFGLIFEPEPRPAYDIVPKTDDSSTHPNWEVHARSRALTQCQGSGHSQKPNTIL